MIKDLDLILEKVDEQVKMDTPYLIFFCASYNLKVTDYMLLREEESSKLQINYVFETEQGQPIGIYNHNALIPLLQNALRLTKN